MFLAFDAKNTKRGQFTFFPGTGIFNGELEYEAEKVMKRSDSEIRTLIDPVIEEAEKGHMINGAVLNNEIKNFKEKYFTAYTMVKKRVELLPKMNLI